MTDLQLQLQLQLRLQPPRALTVAATVITVTVTVAAAVTVIVTAAVPATATDAQIYRDKKRLGPQPPPPHGRGGDMFYIQPPPEACEPDGTVWQACCGIYGLGDAPKWWTNSVKIVEFSVLKH